MGRSIGKVDVKSAWIIYGRAEHVLLGNLVFFYSSFPTKHGLIELDQKTWSMIYEQ